MVTQSHGLEVQGGATVAIGIFALLAKLVPTMQVLACLVTITVGVITLVGIYRKWRKGEW